MYDKPEEFKKYNFCVSVDDKASVRLDMSTGFDKNRGGKIFQVTDEDHQKKLPKYDFPDSKLYVTPASHRIMNKEVIEVEGQQKVKLTDEQSFVFFRPKYYVGSSGTVWTNEQFSIFHNFPQFYEVESGVIQTAGTSLRKYCHMIRDKLLHFQDACVREDVLDVNGEQCRFREYQLKLLHATKDYIMHAEEMYSESSQNITQNEGAYFEEIDKSVKEFVSLLDRICEDMGKKLPGERLWYAFTELIAISSVILTCIEKVHLPEIRSNICELTDGGPGVAVNNHDVQLRIAEKVRILNASRYNRVHPGRFMSGDNEAKRTDSAISKALGIGHTIHADYYALFDGLESNEIDSLDILEYEERLNKCVEKNVWRACFEL